MANPDSIVPLVFQKWNPHFKEFDYALFLNGPFEITTPLDAVQKEAGAKGMGVIVMVSLVDLEEIYGRPDVELEEDKDEQEPTNPG